VAKNTSVIGIYEDRTTVSDVIDVLHKAGYRAADISVLSSENQGTKDFAHEKHTKAPAGAGIGAAVGAVVGAALAWFVSNQTVTITGLGPLVAAGPLLAALAGAGAGGGAGLDRGIAGGPASDRIRRQAVRRQSQVWRRSPIRSLRQSGVV
jgi:hypothetical protein